MKIRVMVVDDEPIAAQSTALMIKQADTELDVVGMCFSGREAVNSAAALHPELIIMDIQMPGINGLEAMSRIQKQRPDTQFIILSAYSEFSYAVEALNLGACDYLLKPVKQAALDASIQKAMKDIRAKQLDMDRELIQQERLEIAQPMIEKDFIRALLPGSNADEKLIACASFLGLASKTCFAFALSATGERSVQSMASLFKKLAKQAALVYDIVTNELAIACVPVPDGAQEVSFARETTARLDDLLLQFAQNGEKLSAGRGGLAHGVVDIKVSLMQAICALRFSDSKITKPRCTVFDGAIMKLNRISTSAQENIPEQNIISSAKQIIDRATMYIRENYQRDLSLDDVASEVNLSPYYFSRFFKEYTGSNFIELLLQIRIEKAKELLLQENCSVKDAAYQVGYNDPNYFSRVFRKATGIKASHYRALFGRKSNDSSSIL